MRRAKLFLLAVILVCGSASAEEAPIVYVKAGKVLDVRAGWVLTEQVIVIRGERIERVAPAAEVRIRADATVIDLSRATVLPGLIDAHTHLTSDHRYHGYRSLGLSVPRQALHGAANARRTLEAGFTTVRDVSGEGYADVALREAISEGDIPGPRMLASGPALGITGGHCDDNLLPAEYAHRAEGVADGPWAVRQKVREVIKYGADLIKFCATGGVLSKGDEPGTQQYTLEEMRAIVEEAHQLGRRVAAHAHGAEGIKTAIRAGVDSIEHASLIDEEGIALARQHGTALVVNLYTTFFIIERGAEVGILPESIEKSRSMADVRPQHFARAHRGGARLVFGTDAGVFPHGENARQFALMVRYGMTPLEAIQAATIHAAELLGWGDRVGALEPGKFADLIGVEGDPLADVTVLERVKFVMQGGQLVRNDFQR
ncbi:MAG: amidohydrolase family protein [Acidobacteria bacterium]|nr:amidohydrolase family protein [Acidobacteriota bacterium]